MKWRLFFSYFGKQNYYYSDERRYYWLERFLAHIKNVLMIRLWIGEKDNWHPMHSSTAIGFGTLSSLGLVLATDVVDSVDIPADGGSVLVTLTLIGLMCNGPCMGCMVFSRKRWWKSTIIMHIMLRWFSYQHCISVIIGKKIPNDNILYIQSIWIQDKRLLFFLRTHIIK